MLITLFIQSYLIPILTWNEISPFVLIKASIWLFSLSILPGTYFLRLSRVLENKSILIKLAIGFNLSFALVGLVTLCSYYTNTLRLLPFIFLGFLSFAFLVYWLKYKFKQFKIEFKLSKYILFLIFLMVASIIIAFSVQEAQRYLIAGDNWGRISLTVKILNNRNIYPSYLKNKYPLMFDFILAGLYICSGLPSVNTYVSLFPLIALNILTFFVLLRTGLNLEERVSIIASTIYALTGGLGWLINTLFYNGNLEFWKLSNITQDMYFSFLLWNNIQFSYKTLALTIAYTSIITITLSIKIQELFRKIIMLILTSFLILFSFFIHMLEPMIFLPVIFIILFSYEEKLKSYLYLGFFILLTSLIFITIDFLMSGYYIWLTMNKINTVLLPRINLFHLTLLFGLSSIIFISIYAYKIKFKNFFSTSLEENNLFNKLKVFIIMILIIIYLLGPYFWINAPKNIYVHELTPIPWYYYITRHGFMGLLALIGLGLSKWNIDLIKVTSSWFLVTLIIGNLWWSSRMTIYLHPIVAIFAAIGFDMILKRVNTNILINIIENSSKSHKRIIKLRARAPLIAILIIPIILLSTSSVFYMVSYYILNGPSLNDNEAKALLWIYQNTPKNATILVPNIYEIYRGVEKISEREIYISNNLPTIDQNLMKILGNYNISYAVIVGDEISSSLRLLLQYSTLEFDLGDIKVYNLPDFIS